jgi:glyoxylase-like metal-dependent hydrolase (beta-lactamase superfamily II)
VPSLPGTRDDRRVVTGAGTYRDPMPEVPRSIRHDTGFVEVADRCWVARFEFLDVNVGLVGGDRGLLVVDTHASEVAARRVVEQVRALGAGEVVAVVNTHQHFDHTFGNVVFLEEYAEGGGPPVYAHDTVPDDLATSAPTLQREARDDRSRPEHADVAATRVVAPTHTFSSARAVDLGDRLVELVHPGRGHTAGDVVVRVGDADVMFAGDLVEESAMRSGVPGFGADCFPMEWPATLDLVIQMLGEEAVVVPGHGLPVSKDFVQEQRSAVGVVAETIRDLASRGVPVAEALDAAEWPYPKEELRDAVARGYEHLPRAARSLPLL